MIPIKESVNQLCGIIKQSTPYVLVPYYILPIVVASYPWYFMSLVMHRFILDHLAEVWHLQLV